MPSELIAVFGTLGGALLVGVINYFSSRNFKNYEWRLTIAKDKVSAQQKLYASFLTEAHRLTIQGREGKITSLSDFNEMDCKTAEICLVASEEVNAAAKRLAEHAISSQSTPSSEDVRQYLSLRGSFIQAARTELAAAMREV